MASFEEVRSEAGEDMFREAGLAERNEGQATAQDGSKTQGRPSVGFRGLVRDAPEPSSTGWGRGPVPVDRRKFGYDVYQGKKGAPLPFSATKVDRMDASQAGQMLDSIHRVYGIEREEESRLVAFDNAMFYEHAVNGASLMQPGRGTLQVDGMSFDIGPIKEKLGVDQRRFFRAYADEVIEVLSQILDRGDPFDPVSAEMVGAIKQVAAERGLQKYPALIADSAEAAIKLSYDERAALANSKRGVLETTVNVADSWIAPRTVGAKPAG